MSYNVFLYDPRIFEWWLAGSAYKEPNKDKRVKTVQEWRRIEQAHFTFNLGIFGMSTGWGCSHVYAKGQWLAYGSDKPKTLILNSENQCKGYSDGIIDDQIKINLPMRGSALRNAVGMTTDGFLIVAQTSHATTETVFCNEVRSRVKARGHSIRLLTLQDGGGSTAGVSSITNLSTGGSRPVPNVLCIRFREMPVFTAPIYNGRTGIEAELMQIALLIDADRFFGPNSVRQLNRGLAAIGLPKGMQTSMADYYALKKMGFEIGY